MSGLARISYPDGELMLPAGTAYELDVLWDHVQWYTRRHGGLRVELEPNEWFVTKRTGNNPNACSRCHNRPRRSDPAGTGPGP